jgi:excisionase family DNA binding protein
MTGTVTCDLELADRPDTKSGQKQLLRIQTVADLCGVSTRAVYRWLNHGELPLLRLPGTGMRPILRIASHDFDAWLERHRHDPEVEKEVEKKTLDLAGIRFMPSAKAAISKAEPVPTSIPHPDADRHQRRSGRRKRILTWKPNCCKRGGGGRWCKQAEGVLHYFGRAKSPDDAEARRQAESRYFEFLQKRRASAPIKIPLVEATLAQVSEKFLQHSKARYDRGEISGNHLERLRGDLTQFSTAIGAQQKITSISELDLEDYRTHALTRPNSNKTGRPISPFTAQGRLSSVRIMIRWAWRMHLIENLPRNLDGIASIPNSGQPKVHTFSLDELKLLWAKAKPRLRCWIALALNCGIGQRDVSDLKVGEVDWDGGYIERERSKTGVKTKHKLWAATLELLKQHGRADASFDEPVFLTMNGLSLVRRDFQGDKFCHSDAVKNAFDRLLTEVDLNGHRRFYCLRKTGATMIESIDPATTEMYLGHVERGMKKHYAERDWARLERALMEMELRLSGVLTA